VRQKPVESSQMSYDQSLASRLWKESAELTGVRL
jgi:hypothetical protein